jgi:hypothetical protein
MVERVLESADLTEMDAMISRAAAAYERYRQAALEEGGRNRSRSRCENSRIQ